MSTNMVRSNSSQLFRRVSFKSLFNWPETVQFVKESNFRHNNNCYLGLYIRKIICKQLHKQRKETNLYEERYVRKRSAHKIRRLIKCENNISANPKTLLTKFIWQKPHFIWHPFWRTLPITKFFMFYSSRATLISILPHYAND